MASPASLSDFGNYYQPANQTPVGFSLAGDSVSGGLASQGAGLNQQRILRNFSQFNLPDLVNSQAARGAFHSSATGNKANRLGTFTSDDYADQTLGLAPLLAQNSINGLLAQTGFRL